MTQEPVEKEICTVSEKPTITINLENKEENTAFFLYLT